MMFDEMKRMQREMDALFESFFRREPFSGHLLEGPSRDVAEYRPPVCDVMETDKEIVARIELPGISKEDIKIHVSDDGIEIKAESRMEEKQKDAHRVSFAGFYRSFSLPRTVEAARAKAEYKDGMLRITMPKRRLEESGKRLLEIQ